MCILGKYNLLMRTWAAVENHFLLFCESKLENMISAPPMMNAPVAMYKINMI